MPRKRLLQELENEQTAKEAKKLIKELIPLVEKSKADVVICTPLLLFDAVRLTKGTNIAVGAQNIHFEEKELIREVSADMLVDIGVKYVIIGHSERRQYFGDTDETVNLKLKQPFQKALYPSFAAANLCSSVN